MQQLPKRLLSIDTLRAVTMLLMIFVNDVSGVKNIPAWIEHVKATEDGLGFADTIFPAFLFIVGLSLPFAINNKFKKGDSSISIVVYLLSRSAALLIMGFYHVNLEEYNPTAILPQAVWAIIITISFFLIWLDYPETISKTKKYTLIGTGVALLLLMAIVYKGGTAENPTGMHTSWWGILGIIGWAYLVCSVVYFFTKGKTSILVACLIAFAAVNITVHMQVLPGGIWLIGDASSVTLVMGGIVVSNLYAYLVAKGKTQNLLAILAAIGTLLIILGLWIRPFTEGISKIHATSAWVFICAGITILVFLLAIYVVDIKGKKNLFSFIRPAGTSTLTCYLMPYFQVYLLQLFHINYPEVLNNGFPGILRSMFTALILIWIVGWMEKRRLRLKI